MPTGNLRPSSRGARGPYVSNGGNRTCLSFTPSPTPRLQDPDSPRPAVGCTLMTSAETLRARGCCAFCGLSELGCRRDGEIRTRGVGSRGSISGRGWRRVSRPTKSGASREHLPDLQTVWGNGLSFRRRRDRLAGGRVGIWGHGRLPPDTRSDLTASQVPRRLPGTLIPSLGASQPHGNNKNRRGNQRAGRRSAPAEQRPGRRQGP